MKLYDITPTASERLGVWPGDVPLTLHRTMSPAEGDTVTVTEIRGTVHLGAHADGPLHFDPRGADISRVPLEPYLGPARVWDVGEVRAVEAAHLAGVPWERTRRLLIRTRRRPAGEGFDPGFPALTEEAGALIAARGLLLVGVDVPSVDRFDSRALPNHRALLRARVAILEGLDLSAVEAGEYELIALPLKLEGADSSPVRAVLVEK